MNYVKPAIEVISMLAEQSILTDSVVMPRIDTIDWDDPNAPAYDYD